MSLIKSRTGTAGKSGGKTGSFKYQARSAEEVKERANRSLGNRDSFFNSEVEFFSPKKGDNTVRVLPPTWEDARHYGIDLHIHYGIGVDESGYLCLDKMQGEKCPLCEARVTAASNEEDELADSLKPKQRVAIWVIDRSQENKGPLVWNMPAGVDKDFTNLCVDKKTGEVYSIDNPDEGFDISFTREGEGIKTKYTGLQVARRSSPLSDNPKDQEKWLAYVVEHPLPDILLMHDYDKLSAAYAGHSAHPKEDKEKDKAGDTGGTKIRQRGAPKEEKKDDDPDKPTFEQVQEMDEDTLEAVIKDFKLEPAEDDVDSIEAARAFVCKALELEEPAAPAAEAKGAAKGSWKDKLNKNKK